MEVLRQETDDRSATFVEQNKKNYIEWMTEKVNWAASKGETSASIAKSSDPRYFDGILRTFEAVGDHFAESGFGTSLDSGENSGNDAEGNWHDATYCWAQLTVEWPEIEQTNGDSAL